MNGRTDVQTLPLDLDCVLHTIDLSSVEYVLLMFRRHCYSLLLINQLTEARSHILTLSEVNTAMFGV
jgi:hypothetical protein